MNTNERFHQILWLKSCDSTNSEARRLLPNLGDLSVIAAERQTAGRGQGDHSWDSLPGRDLTFSMVLRPAISARDCRLISCVAALGVRDYLLSEGIDARIKLPNDIWVDGRKICGILIENILDGKNIEASIVGIGLNLNRTEWPENLPNPVSMKELTGVEREPGTALEALALRLAERAGMLVGKEGRDNLERDFDALSFSIKND